MLDIETRLNEVTAIKEIVRKTEQETFSKSEVLAFLLRRKTELEDELVKEIQVL